MNYYYRCGTHRSDDVFIWNHQYWYWSFHYFMGIQNLTVFKDLFQLRSSYYISWEIHDDVCIHKGYLCIAGIFHYISSSQFRICDYHLNIRSFNYNSKFPDIVVTNIDSSFWHSKVDPKPISSMICFMAHVQNAKIRDKYHNQSTIFFQGGSITNSIYR